MKISHTRTVEAPSGPVCANWGYRNHMPKQLDFKCEALEDISAVIGNSDAWQMGLGASGGFVPRYRCNLFLAQLESVVGVGPLKCQQCRLQGIKNVQPSDV